MVPIKNKSRQLYLYIVFLFAVIILMIFTKRFSQKDSTSCDIPQINDTLNVAILYGPMSYYIYEDTLGGLNYELLTIFEKDTQTPINFYPVSNLEDTYKKLDSGKFSLVASQPSSYSNKQNYLTTETVFLETMVLIQKKDYRNNSKIKSYTDLQENDTIYITPNNSVRNTLNNIVKNHNKSCQITEIEGINEEMLMKKVSEGNIKYAMIHQKIASSLMTEFNNVSYGMSSSLTYYQEWILSKSDSLLQEKINNWLDTFLISERYRNLIERYR